MWWIRALKWLRQTQPDKIYNINMDQHKRGHATRGDERDYAEQTEKVT